MERETLKKVALISGAFLLAAVGAAFFGSAILFMGVNPVGAPGLLFALGVTAIAGGVALNEYTRERFG